MHHYEVLSVLIRETTRSSTRLREVVYSQVELRLRADVSEVVADHRHRVFALERLVVERYCDGSGVFRVDEVDAILCIRGLSGGCYRVVHRCTQVVVV